jgi:hypothetical protein
MHFQVPQFIDIEDRIVGPLTIKQFLYVAAGFLIIFFSFFVLNFYFWLVFTILIAIISASFAFVKYNGRSFLTLLTSMINYYWRPRIYIWKKKGGKQVAKKGLSNLKLKLDTSSKPIKGEKSFMLPFLQRLKKMKNEYEVFRKTTGEREVARRVDYR